MKKRIVFALTILITGFVFAATESTTNAEFRPPSGSPALGEIAEFLPPSGSPAL